MMRPDYYNYRYFTSDIIEDLYLDMAPQSFAVATDFNLEPVGYAIAFTLQESCTACGKLFTLGPTLHITLESPHWLLDEWPQNKFESGPFIRYTVDNSMTNRLLAQRQLDATACGLLPVALDLDALAHLYLVETPPDRATHLLVRHCKPLVRTPETPPPQSSEIAYFDCGVKAGYYTLHEFGRFVQEAYRYTCDVGKETMVRQRLCQDEAAFQRYVGSTCPSTAAMRLAGHLEHGLV